MVELIRHSDKIRSLVFNYSDTVFFFLFAGVSKSEGARDFPETSGGKPSDPDYIHTADQEADYYTTARKKRCDNRSTTGRQDRQLGTISQDTSGTPSAKISLFYN